MNTTPFQPRTFKAQQKPNERLLRIWRTWRSMAAIGFVTVLILFTTRSVTAQEFPSAIQLETGASNTTGRISRGWDGAEADGSSSNPAISADGCRVAFESDAKNLVDGLVGGDRDGKRNVFVYDCQSGGTILASDLPDADPESDFDWGYDDAHEPAISADGRFVAFHAYYNGVGSEISENQVFVYDFQSGKTSQIYVGGLGAEDPALSADGRYVALRAYFQTKYYIYVYDRVTDQETRIATTANGEPVNGDSYSPAISADGCRVAFESDATNLVDGLVGSDRDGKRNVFVYDCQSGATRLASDLPDADPEDDHNWGHGDAHDPAISADGRFVAFHAYYSGFGDEIDQDEVFVYDLDSGERSVIASFYYYEKPFLGPQSAVLSADGRYVAFRAHPIDIGDMRYNIFVYDRVTGQATRISTSVNDNSVDGDASSPVISANARFVAFASNASNLVDEDNNDYSDIFIHDRGVQPIAANDRYDVAKDGTLYVAAPGVLGNDINANGDARLYYLSANGNGSHISELARYNNAWHYRDITAEATPWSAARSSAAPPPSGNALTSTSVNGEPRVYYKANGPGGEYVYELAWDDQAKAWKWRDFVTASSSTDSVTPIDAASPLAATTVNDSPRVYYLGKDGHVHELAWVVDTWRHRDITNDASAPAAAPGTLAATKIANDDPRVYYLTADGHIHELAWRSLTQVWYHQDLNATLAEAPTALNLAASGAASPLAVTTANLEPRVYFLASVSGELHVGEFSWYANAWHYNDVTIAIDDGMATSVARPDQDSSLAATTIDSRGDPRVYYQAKVADGSAHIYELAWYSSDTSWHYRDVTNDGAGTPPDLNSPLAVTAEDLLPQVYYRRDQQVHQLAWNPPDYWHDADLLAVANWPSAIADSPLSATTAGNNSLTVGLVSKVSHGELTLYDDGSFVYKPQSGFTGSDGFTYVASAGSAQSLATTVELVVTDECAPVDGNLIRNFCFADGKTEWKFFHSADSNGSYNVSSSSPFAGESAAAVTVSTPGRIQLFQDKLVLQPNTTYELAFAANSTNGADMRVYVHQQRAPYDNFGIAVNAGYPLDLKPYWKHFTFTFTTPNVPAQELANMRLRFWFRGAKAGTVFQIDRVFLRTLDRPEGASELVAASSFNDEYMSDLLAGAEVPDDSVAEGQMNIYLPVVSGQ